MKNQTKSKRKKWIGRIFAGILFSLIAFLTYVQLWYHPPLTKGPMLVLPEKVLSYHKAGVWAAKFSPDGAFIVSGSVDSAAVIADVKTGAIVHILKHPGGITYVCYSRRGDMIVTSGYDKIIRIWNAGKGEMIRELKGHETVIRSLDISPDGETIASGSEEGVIKLWKASTGECTRTIPAHKRIVWDIKFSPDGRSLASASFDYTIRIWNVSDGALKTTLTAHTQTVVALAYSHDGKLLASTSDDKTIKIWSTKDFSIIREFHQPEHPQGASFSPDDKWLITGGRDKPLPGEFLQNIFGDSHYNPGVSMRLWDVQNGKLLQTFREHFNDVNDVDFSPDGKHVVSASNDNTVRLWRVTTDK